MAAVGMARGIKYTVMGSVFSSFGAIGLERLVAPQLNVYAAPDARGRSRRWRETRARKLDFVDLGDLVRGIPDQH